MGGGAFFRLEFPGGSFLVGSSGRLYMVLPMWAQLSLDWVLCCCGNLAKDEISYIELSQLHPLVVLFSHLSLVFCHSTGSFFSYFVQAVQVKS